MKRLSYEENAKRIELVREYMELEESYFDLEKGLVKIQKLCRGRYETVHRKEQYTADGYIYYSLRDKNANKSVTVYAHQIIMMLSDPEAYLEHIGKNQMTINHINGNKQDNKVSNLEYLSQSDNITHAYVTGLMQFKVIPLEQVVAVLSLFIKDGLSVEEISDVTKVSKQAVKEILNRKKHKGVHTIYCALEGITPKVKQNKAWISEEVVIAILDKGLGEKKQTSADIAKELGIGRSSVDMILKGKRRKKVFDRYLRDE